MPLHSGQYTTPFELASSELNAERYNNLLPYFFPDVDNIPVELLPYIAYLYGIDGNIEFLPEEVRRAIIKNSWYFYDNLGTQAALDKAEEVLEINITHTISDIANGLRGIAITISPPIYAIADPNWAQYIRDFVARLLPYTLRLTSIIVLTVFEADIYISGGLGPYDFVENRGGIAENS